MRRLGRAGRLLKARLADERGFTLIELLVAMFGGLVVAGAAMAFIIIVIDQQNDAASRSAAVTQAETGLQQMTRDLRNAMYETTSSTSTYYNVAVTTNASTKTTSLTFDIPTPGTDGTGESVTWTCPSTANASTYVGSCTRSLAGGSARPLIAGVQSAAFSLTENPPTDVTTTVTPSTTASGTTTYPSSTTFPLANVAVTLNVQDISQLDSTQSHIVRGVGNTIQLQTSADLRNFA